MKRAWGRGIWTPMLLDILRSPNCKYISMTQFLERFARQFVFNIPSNYQWSLNLETNWLLITQLASNVWKLSFLIQINNLGERHRFSFYFFNHITFNSKSWWTMFFKVHFEVYFLLRNKFSFLKHVSISSRGSMIGNDDDQT